MSLTFTRPPPRPPRPRGADDPLPLEAPPRLLRSPSSRPRFPPRLPRSPPSRPRFPPRLPREELSSVKRCSISR